MHQNENQGHSRSVLVVDDEPGILRICCKLLERAGYHTTQATNAQEAIALVQTCAPNILLVDKNLGAGLTGVDVIRQTRRVSPMTKSILMTGYPSAESAIETVKLGAFDYLQKPVSREVLLRTVGQAEQAFVYEYEQEIDAERHDSLFELTPGLAWFADESGIIQSVNRGGADALGYEADELIGRPYTSIVADEHPSPSVKWTFLERRSGSTATSAKLISLKTKSGETRLYRVHVRASVTSEKGSGSVGVGHDVTEIVGIHQRLKQADRTESLGHFVAEVVHEYNNLLSVINSNSDMLADEIAGHTSGHDELAAIQEAGHRAANLATSLLKFARNEPQESSLLRLNGVVSGLELLLGRLLPPQYSLQVDDKLGPDFEVSGDCQQLEQVVMNLVINARDAMPNGGALRIELAKARELPKNFSDTMRHATNYAYISVIDQGTGITPALLNTIREPFVSTKGSNGTGLGLFTVDRIVRQHDGFFEIKSEENQGTVATVYLPASGTK